MDRNYDKQFKNDKKKPLPRTPQEKKQHEMDWKTQPIKKTYTIKDKKKEDNSPHSPNKKDKYPDYKPKDDEGGTKVPKKPAPKSPMSPAAKKLKRTASRSK
jgi:hypothetical protein